MRKSLTKKEILRNKADIAELFASAKRPSKRSQPITPQATAPAKNKVGKRSTARTGPKLAEIQRAKDPHCKYCHMQSQTDGLKLILLLQWRDQSPRTLQADAPQADAPQAEQMVFISPVKSLGNAVQRNRAKRLQREFYRHSKQQLQSLAHKIAQKKWGIELGNSELCPPKLYSRWAIVIQRPASPEQPKELRTQSKTHDKTQSKTQSKTHDKKEAKTKTSAKSVTLEFNAELYRYQNLVAQLEQSITKMEQAS